MFSIILEIVDKLIFALYGTWGPLGVGKILLRGMGTICPPGEYHSAKHNFVMSRVPIDPTSEFGQEYEINMKNI